MVVKVIGMWELGWSTPIMEYDLWHFPLRNFEVDELCMCPVSGIVDKKVTEYASVAAALAANAELTPVYLHQKGTTKLTEFEHPADAIYVLGKASRNPNIVGDMISVCIETANGKGLLWPHQAISIALHDRLVKSWR